ncbi:uncharacterized protein LOC144106689 [Amblyomma americanum]
MPPSCIICKTRCQKGPGISLHVFPHNNKDLLQKWLSAIRTPLPNLHIGRRICSRHFEQSCFYSGHTRHFLKPDAVPTIFQNVQSEQVASTSCGAISGLQSLPRTSLQKRKREHASPEATSSQTMSSPSSRAQLPLRKSPRLQAISVRPHLSQPVTSPIPKSPCKHLHTPTRKSLRKRKQDMSAPQTPSSVAASPWKSPRKCLQTATPVCASSRMHSEDQGATSPAEAAVKVQHKVCIYRLLWKLSC